MRRCNDSNPEENNTKDTKVNLAAAIAIPMITVALIFVDLIVAIVVYRNRKESRTEVIKVDENPTYGVYEENENGKMKKTSKRKTSSLVARMIRRVLMMRATIVSSRSAAGLRFLSQTQQLRGSLILMDGTSSPNWVLLLPFLAAFQPFMKCLNNTSRPGLEHSQEC